MAKLTYFDNSVYDPDIEANYHPRKMERTTEAGGEIEYTDSINDYRVSFHGIGFRYRQGDVVDGAVNAVHFVDAESSVFVRVEGLDIRAERLDDAMLGKFGVSAVLASILGSDDIISGSPLNDILNGEGGRDIVRGFDGIDTIYCSRGNDRLSGGGDTDFIVFSKSDGHDRVVDFELGIDAIVLASGEFDHFERRNGGTVVVFERGSIFLDDVSFADRRSIEILIGE